MKLFKNTNTSRAFWITYFFGIFFRSYVEYVWKKRLKKQQYSFFYYFNKMLYVFFHYIILSVSYVFGAPRWCSSLKRWFIGNLNNRLLMSYYYEYNKIMNEYFVWGAKQSRRSGGRRWKVSRNTLACSLMFLCSKCILQHHYHINHLELKMGLWSWRKSLQALCHCNDSSFCILIFTVLYFVESEFEKFLQCFGGMMLHKSCSCLLTKSRKKCLILVNMVVIVWNWKELLCY